MKMAIWHIMTHSVVKGHIWLTAAKIKISADRKKQVLLIVAKLTFVISTSMYQPLCVGVIHRV